MGASVATVLPEIGKQVTAKSWAVAHVQLTEEEAGRLEGIPVTYACDMGFFYELDKETRLLKVSNSGAGYTNYISAESGIDDIIRVSVPLEENKLISEAEEEAARKVFSEHLPSLAGRPLVERWKWKKPSTNEDQVVDQVVRWRVETPWDLGEVVKMGGE